MKILVVNDDGITSYGIERLAAAALELGEVWVIAPASQCSGMSMKLTLAENMPLTGEDFPIEGVTEAYRLGGTPADCVKTALNLLMKEKPDLVLSGVNNGWNCGVDVHYSGTCGAAMEASLWGIPAIALSNCWRGDWETLDNHMLPIIRKLMSLPTARGDVWNVNFPGCPESELKGIAENVKLAPIQLFSDRITETVDENGVRQLSQMGTPVRAEDAPAGTDINLVLSGYITIGKIHSYFEA